MAKGIVRARDYESASRKTSELELGELETAAIVASIGDERARFPLLSRLAEEDYGPEGDLCIMPSQLPSFKEELQRFLNLPEIQDLNNVLHSYGRSIVRSKDVERIAQKLIGMSQDAITNNESIFAFAD